jgi:tetratricopeptide (TPR) repeat protein
LNRLFRPVTLLLLALALLTGCGGGDADAPEPPRHAEALARADRAVTQGDLTRAREILTRILEEDTKSFDARYRLGVLTIPDAPREALRHLAQAAAIQPDHPGPRFFAGMARLSLSDFSGADRDMREGVRLARLRREPAPADTTDAVAEGLMRLRLGQPAAAHEAFAEAAKAAPGDPAVWTLLGRSALAAGRLIDAEHAAGRALELEPGAPLASLLLAIVHLREGRNAPARDELDRILESAPHFAAAYYHRGSLNLKVSEFRAAADDFWAAVLEDPTIAEHHQGLGRTYHMMRMKTWSSQFLTYTEWVAGFHTRNPR